jgi:hypothetical protein
MRKKIIGAAVLAVALGAGLNACGGSDKGASSPAPTVTVTTPAKVSVPKTSSTESSGAELPDFTGEGLQDAQDDSQAAGFYVLDSSDASGAGRMQLWDRDWTVCSQDPAAGTYDPATTTVTFSTVKLDETCP